ncbi:hypothetical protein RUESEDTHA_04104 [Ruegeria sp. THAF57]|uniref:hypothetical protein n=1 Tax=Ruegeria sp. THAF57 TaxID=2744555 RepID=UPI0015DDADEF|nr:hypothetical protein [Ruegeria sp. THAF57]CAD0187192.1 hypothetical protein RUESEDTHA_04104 [Ruegeria sp. THAF57]
MIAQAQTDITINLAQLRQKYMRPILLGIIGGLFAETMFLFVQGVLLYPGKPVSVMMFWGVFCGIGMGGAAGIALNLFVVDRFEDQKAILPGTLAAFVPYAACGYFCYEIALNTGYYGAREMGLLFVAKNLVISFFGSLLIASLLFTQRGRAMLKALRL